MISFVVREEVSISLAYGTGVPGIRSCRWPSLMMSINWGMVKSSTLSAESIVLDWLATGLELGQPLYPVLEIKPSPQS